MPQCRLCSSFRTSLALGEADGVSGPVIHQLMQVISEGAFALLGVRSWGGGPSCLGQGGGVVLALSWTICGAGPTWSWETRREVNWEINSTNWFRWFTVTRFVFAQTCGATAEAGHGWRGSELLYGWPAHCCGRFWGLCCWWWTLLWAGLWTMRTLSWSRGSWTYKHKTKWYTYLHRTKSRQTACPYLKPKLSHWHQSKCSVCLQRSFTVCTWVYGAGLSTTASRSVAFTPTPTSRHRHSGGDDRRRRRFSHPRKQRLYLLFLTSLQGLDLHHMSKSDER